MPGLIEPPLPKGKIRIHGLEVTKSLDFYDWHPGLEYTKNITLKNVELKTQKLTFSNPRSRFFTSIYPKPTKISAGTTFTIPITFRPLEKVVYKDCVSFKLEDGFIFDIKINGNLPTFAIDVLSVLDMGMCAVKDTFTSCFTIRNLSPMKTKFKINCPEPFIVEPVEGNLDGKNKGCDELSITVEFKPEQALRFSAIVVIQYGNNNEYEIATNFLGVGKFPHLVIALPDSKNDDSNKPHSEFGEKLLDFGVTTAHLCCEKSIELVNYSPVPCKFQINRMKGNKRIDNVFNIKQKTGTIPPSNSIKLPVFYEPNCIGTENISYFEISTISNVSKSILKCIGKSIGPTVYLTSDTVNFGKVDENCTGSVVIEIVNESKQPAIFQFDNDNVNSVFTIDPRCGQLPDMSRTNIVLKFQPKYNINYYKRISCLIHNHKPIFFDVIGTCHSDMEKPAILQKHHVVKFKVHKERGFTTISPPDINKMLEEKSLVIDKNGYICDQNRINSSGYCLEPPIKNPFEEYLDLIHDDDHIQIDKKHVNFGRILNLQETVDETINLTNRTKGKLTVCWITDTNKVFSVSPNMVDIPPLKSYSFRVTFKPKEKSAIYGGKLEAYAFYKSLRDYRMVQSVSHFLPFCVTFGVSGHTFPPNQQSFIPKISFNPKTLVFPSANQGDETFRTLCIYNESSQALMFNSKDLEHGVFSVEPRNGFLKKDYNYQMFVVKFNPEKIGTFQEILTFILNGSESNLTKVPCYGTCEQASVMLNNDGYLYFKPTCVGTESRQMYCITNDCRLPMAFEWKIHSDFRKMLRVEPSKGIIEPNEKQYHEWFFKPETAMKYLIKPTIVAWGKNDNWKSSVGKKREFHLRVIGKGDVGGISVQESYIDFGTIVVNTSAYKYIKLRNNSDCSIEYKLHLQDTANEELESVCCCHLANDEESGKLAARSVKTIQVIMRPKHNKTYQVNLHYSLIQNNSETSKETLCQLIGTGVFPSLNVIDVRTSGCAKSMNKKQIWNLFSLDKLNKSLANDPQPAELIYNRATRQSYRKKIPVYTRSILDFNFSAAPLESKPFQVDLVVENNGIVDCEWEFLFPNDLQMELEYWAETGEFNEDELHELKILDNRLFTIEPQKGLLQAGEKQIIRMEYSHDIEGSDKLPVLLKIAKGREILINFIGVTVEYDTTYVHFPSNKFVFAPVAVGSDSPKQTYELFNGGSRPIRFEIDCTQLHQLQERNFDHAVFECLLPRGQIEPMTSFHVEWKFTPLEAKTYTVDVPIHIHNGDTALITFIGIGFDKRDSTAVEGLVLNEPSDAIGVPNQQKVVEKNQLCFLSLERLSFGDVPLFTKVRRTVAVSNKNANHAISFNWLVSNKNHANFIKVEPSTGFLEAKQSMLCKIVLITMGKATFYDIDLICQINNMTEVAAYKKKVDAWQLEYERQKVEFTITEKNLHADKYLPQSPTVSPQPPPPPPLSTTTNDDLPADNNNNANRTTESPVRLTRVERQTAPVEFSKYQTLPPIKTSDLVTLNKLRMENEAFERLFWIMPKAPKPFVMRLFVTGRSHSTKEFLENFPDKYFNYFIDKSLSVNSLEESKLSVSRVNVDCNEYEKDASIFSLSVIIKTLLEESTFKQALKNIKNDPIPYFQQIQIKKSNKKLDRKGSDTIKDILDENSINENEPASHNQDEVDARDKCIYDVFQPTPPVTPATKLDMTIAKMQTLKKNPSVGCMVENVIENTLSNVLQEAFAREFNLTARPRLIAMLPRPKSNSSVKSE